MKKILILGMVLMLAGCTSTKITTYDKDGNIVKIEEATSDIVQKITDSAKNKTLIIWDSGWAGYISVSPGTQEDPSPHGKVFLGKVDKGYISIHKDATKLDWDGIAAAISATNKSVGIKATGIGSITETK